MELKYTRGSHAVFNLQYHLILVTKFRRKCINEAVFQAIRDQFEKVAGMNSMTIDEIAYEEDHVHVLFSAIPGTNLAMVIGSMKSTSSRRVRQEHEKHLSAFYWKDFFWSRSYLLLSSGGAPIEVIRAYIQEQGTEEHKAKSARRKRAANST